MNAFLALLPVLDRRGDESLTQCSFFLSFSSLTRIAPWSDVGFFGSLLSAVSADSGLTG